MTKGGSSVAEDAQLRAADTFEEAQTLLDVMLKQFHTMERNRTDPFISKVVIAGELKEDSSRPFSQVFQELIDAATVKSRNPLSEQSCPPSPPSGIFLDYGTHFVGLFEAVDRYVAELLILMDAECKSTEEPIFSDVRVLYLNDDVVPLGGQYVCFVDKIPGVVAQSEKVDVPEDVVAEMVADDVRKLTKLLSLVLSEGVSKRKNFLDNARTSHPTLFPNTSSLKMYVKSDLFLTLDEYHRVFGKLPELVRDVEVNHPVDQPLKY